MAAAESSSTRCGKTRVRRPTQRFEREARASGYGRIAGVDEVGRGCLFGPVVAAAVILDPERPLRGLADSKLLDARTRELLAARIRERALAYGVAGVDAAWIDRVNIYQASRRAMQAAVAQLSPPPDYLLIDAMTIERNEPQRAIIHGDKKCRSIAAASILAKVERDGWMRRWAEVYPEYDLASNKGYASPKHLAALREFGPTPAHRFSFEPVARAARFPCRTPPWAADRQMALFSVAGGC